jgi:hypothetical protein
MEETININFDLNKGGILIDGIFQNGTILKERMRQISGVEIYQPQSPYDPSKIIFKIKDAHGR